jgi:hypothetical protein
VYPVNIRGAVTTPYTSPSTPSIPTAPETPSPPVRPAASTSLKALNSSGQAGKFAATPFDKYAVVDRPAAYLQERGRDEYALEQSLGAVEPEELSHVVSELQDPLTGWDRRKALVSLLYQDCPGSGERADEFVPKAAAATICAPADTPIFRPLADVGKV